MARPRKFYVVFNMGRAIDVVSGLEAARKVNAGWHSHRTQLGAEEFAAWWNYQRDQEIIAASTTANVVKRAMA